MKNKRTRSCNFFVKNSLGIGLLFLLAFLAGFSICWGVMNIKVSSEKFSPDKEKSSETLVYFSEKGSYHGGSFKYPGTIDIKRRESVFYDNQASWYFVEKKYLGNGDWESELWKYSSKEKNGKKIFSIKNVDFNVFFSNENIFSHFLILFSKEVGLLGTVERKSAKVELFDYEKFIAEAKLAVVDSEKKYKHFYQFDEKTKTLIGSLSRLTGENLFTINLETKKINFTETGFFHNAIIEDEKKEKVILEYCQKPEDGGVLSYLKVQNLTSGENSLIAKSDTDCIKARWLDEKTLDYWLETEGKNSRKQIKVD